MTRKVSLGLKQLTPSPWDDVEDTLRAGQDGQGQGHPADGLRRLRRARAGHRGPDPHLRARPERVFRVEDIVKPGQEVEVRILKIEPEAKKIALSLRPLPAPPRPSPKRRRTTTPRAARSPSARSPSRAAWATATRTRSSERYGPASPDRLSTGRCLGLTSGRVIKRSGSREERE